MTCLKNTELTHRSKEIFGGNWGRRCGSSHEAVAGHVSGFAEPEQREDGGGDVAEAAPRAKGGGGGGLIANEQEGYGVGGVSGVRTSGGGVDEHLGVAVVGGDEEGAAALTDGRVDAAELGVYGFDRANRGLHPAGMTDHVGVGEVDDDDVEGGVVDGPDDGVGDAGGGHLGGEIVGGDLLRGDEGAVFAGEGLLDAAVEEVGDVGVLLGLGDAEVAEVRLRHEVGQEVVHAFGRDDDREGEILVVLGHADVVEVRGGFSARDFGVELGGFGEVLAAVSGESGVAGEDAGDLAHAIGAVVEVDADVAGRGWDRRGGLRVDDGEGWDELVGDAVGVALLDAGDGVGRYRPGGGR